MEHQQLERDVILEKPQPVIVSELRRPAWFWRLIGKPETKHTIELKPLPYGVVLQITNCVSQIEIPDVNSIKEIAAYISKNEKQVTDMIAYALNCSQKEPPERLKRFIKRNMTLIQTIEVMYFIIDQCDMGNFIKGIRLMSNRLIPKNKPTEQPQPGS